MISLALYSIAALGLFIVAAKYGLATAPLGYHRSIVEQDGAVSSGTQRVIEALYRVWAATLAGFGLCLLGLIWGPAAAGAAWAHLTIVVATIVMAVPSIIVPRRVEQERSVRTPWRLAAALSACVVIGFIAWLAGY
jgi:hypothetical protein